MHGGWGLVAHQPYRANRLRSRTQLLLTSWYLTYAPESRCSRLPSAAARPLDRPKRGQDVRHHSDISSRGEGGGGDVGAAGSDA